MTINTTGGPVPREHEQARHPAHTLNTTRVVEEDLAYADEEPEIAFVLPAGAWHAELREGSLVPLIAFVVLADGSAHGVAVGERGGIDLFDSVEERAGFVGYVKYERQEKSSD